MIKSNGEHLRRISAEDETGRDIFGKIMSVERFFNLFIENFKATYIFGYYACVDEMFLGLRWNCNSKIYVQPKPKKYVLKNFGGKRCQD